MSLCFTRTPTFKRSVFMHYRAFSRRKVCLNYDNIPICQYASILAVNLSGAGHFVAPRTGLKNPRVLGIVRVCRPYVRAHGAWSSFPEITTRATFTPCSARTGRKSSSDLEKTARRCRLGSIDRSRTRTFGKHSRPYRNISTRW